MSEPVPSEPAEQRIGAPSQPPAAFTNIVVNRIDYNLFSGEESTLWRPPNARGVYGGQIIGQALSAALQTVPPEKHVHSLHCYFLMRGDEKHRIVYRVEVLRDGASFSTRNVTAQQHGKIVFILIASFQVPHVGRAVEHAFKMPVVPRPFETPTYEQYHLDLLKDPRCPRSWRPYLEARTKMGGPIEMRPVVAADFFHGLGPLPSERPKYPELSLDSPKQAFWMRAKNPLPDDPAMHHAVLAYASDWGLISTAKANLSIMHIGIIASLDHSIWFHSPFRADEWLLYWLESNRATDGRGLGFGMVFSERGELVATVAQEGVLRLRKEADVNAHL